VTATVIESHLAFLAVDTVPTYSARAPHGPAKKKFPAEMEIIRRIYGDDPRTWVNREREELADSLLISQNICACSTKIHHCGPPARAQTDRMRWDSSEASDDRRQDSAKSNSSTNCPRRLAAKSAASNSAKPKNPARASPFDLRSVLTDGRQLYRPVRNSDSSRSSFVRAGAEGLSPIRRHFQRICIPSIVPRCLLI
jgi:hypothetical protein